MGRIDRRTFLATSAAGVAATAGCLGLVGGSDDAGAAYRSYGYDQANRGYHPEATGPTEGVELDWKFEGGVSSPAIVGGSAYFLGSVTRNGAEQYGLVSLSRRTGEVQWLYPLPDAEVAATVNTPAVADGTVYFGTRLQSKGGGGRLHAVDAETGDGVWETPLPRSVSASLPIVADDAVVVATDWYIVEGEWNVLAVAETSDGSLRHEIEIPSSPPTYPVFADGNVYYSSLTEDGRSALKRFDVSAGSPSPETVLERESPTSTVSIADGTLYWGGKGWLVAIDAASGTVDWTVEVGDEDTARVAPGPPTVGPDAVYSPIERGIAAVDRSDGTVRWTQAATSGLLGAPFPPTVTDDAVYVVLPDGYYALDPSDGSELWRHAAAGFTTPVVLDDAIYSAGFAGIELVALKAA